MPSGVAEALDHVGIAGPDLTVIAAAYERLGFTLTPLARHSGKRTPDGLVEKFATGNRCIMLRQGYVELIAVVDPTVPGNMLNGCLERYAGIHIVALSMADEAANLYRLRRAGIAIDGVAWLERPVDDADPAGPIARFARVPLPDAPEGRIQLIRHLTPEAIWQDRFLSHPNHAVGLRVVVLALEHPAESAARFSRLAGRPVVPDPAGGFVLKLPRGQVRLLPPKALGSVFPGVEIPALPFIAGIVVATDDGNRAVAALLAERGIPRRTVGDGLLVAPEASGGAAIVFKPDDAARPPAVPVSLRRRAIPPRRFC